MAIDYDSIKSFKFPETEVSYADKDSILYALGVGFGRDPLDQKELQFVYEKNLQAVPSFASVVHRRRVPFADLGINYLMVVHGEQRLTLYKPLPPEGKLAVTTGVAGVFDKGKDKGAILLLQTDVSLKETGEKLYRALSTTFARGDGGFLKPGQKTEGTPPAPHRLPVRAPDRIWSSQTRADQALLYRLCGDRNPLHADPEIAKAAGFDRPILHGLCTYGICCRGVIESYCSYDAALVRQFDVRFSAPVFPGETIVLEMWKDDDVISFRARVRERDALVIDNGRCVLAP